MTPHPQRSATPPPAPWNGDMAEAPLAAEPRTPPRQLALFAPEDLAPAAPEPEPRRKRLPRPLQVFLEVIDKPARKRRARPDDATPAGEATADWLESFFDVTRGA
jgi:hypothetical protein